MHFEIQRYSFSQSIYFRWLNCLLPNGGYSIAVAASTMKLFALDWNLKSRLRNGAAGGVPVASVNMQAAQDIADLCTGNSWPHELCEYPWYPPTKGKIFGDYVCLPLHLDRAHEEAKRLKAPFNVQPVCLQQAPRLPGEMSHLSYGEQLPVNYTCLAGIAGLLPVCFAHREVKMIDHRLQLLQNFEICLTAVNMMLRSGR